jgi:hypothetical protein
LRESNKENVFLSIFPKRPPPGAGLKIERSVQTGLEKTSRKKTIG